MMKTMIVLIAVFLIISIRKSNRKSNLSYVDVIAMTRIGKREIPKPTFIAREKTSNNQIHGQRNDVSEKEECEFFEECVTGNVCHAGENDECPNPFTCKAVEDIHGELL